MEKIWPLKDRIVSGKKLIQIDGVVFRAQEERGDQVHVKLEPGAAASTTSAPAERLLSVPDLCFAYLKYLVSKAKGTDGEDDGSIDDDLELRRAITDVFLEGRKTRKNYSEWAAKMKKAKSELSVNKKQLHVYTKESGGMVPQFELDKVNREIADWTVKAAEAVTEFEIAKARMPTVFYNTDQVLGFCTEKFGFELGHSTLLRYAAEGMPRMGAKGQRPCALSEMAERDLLKVIRYASDRGVSFKNLEITHLATRIRDVEWKYRKDTRPLPAPLTVTWVQSFRNRMRRVGVPPIEPQNSQNSATSSNAFSQATSRSAGSSSSSTGSQSASAVVVSLRTAIVELARQNEDRQTGVELVREERGAEEHNENDEEILEADEEIAALEDQLAQAKAVREGLRNKAKRKAKEAKQVFLPPKRSLETERTVLDRVYTELERAPTELVCGLVGAQIDALQRAPRDAYGAVIASLSGPFVAARPKLESTDESVRQILDEAILLTASRPPMSPRKRRKRAEPI